MNNDTKPLIALLLIITIVMGAAFYSWWSDRKQNRRLDTIIEWQQQSSARTRARIDSMAWRETTILRNQDTIKQLLRSKH